MEEKYSITEKVGNEKRKYVPVSIKIHKRNEKGYNEEAFPWHKLWINKPLKKGETVYVVTYIQHSGSDENAKAFFNEKDVRKYIFALARAISVKNKTDKVEVHYNNGVENLFSVLESIPLNTYVNFRTPTDEYSVTLAKTIY